MFGAIGDATCDRVPLQIGQFESDNRMDEDLARIVLEGGGGGQRRESYELAMYVMARHTDLDSVVKRGRRGYLFIIGDEMAYPQIKPKEVARFVGDKLREPISTEAMLAELRRSFDVYYIMPTAAGWGGDAEILGYWRKLLGQQVIELDDLDAVCETIALTVGLGEESIDLDGGLADLVEVGSTAGTSVGKALAPLGAGRGTVVRGALPAPGTGSGNERL
jgi:hypothetical protein